MKKLFMIIFTVSLMACGTEATEETIDEIVTEETMEKAVDYVDSTATEEADDAAEEAESYEEE